jgi:hypothetical protein
MSRPPSFSPAITPAFARAMFRRTLAAWAGDCLRLRRLGLDRPSARGLLPQRHAAGAPAFQAIPAHARTHDAQERPA